MQASLRICRNPNAPKKGTSTKVEPIRNKADIIRIKTLLAPCPRDFCIFTLGINTAFRAGELVSITIGEVEHLKAGDRFTLKQSKNKKYREIKLNTPAVQAIQNCIASHPDRDNPDAPLLYSKTTGRALKSGTLSKYVKRWCRKVGLIGRYSSHSMRKTWGYWRYRTPLKNTANDVAENCVNDNETQKPIIAQLMLAFGHSTQRQTLEYLCILDEDISDMFDMEL